MFKIQNTSKTINIVGYVNQHSAYHWRFHPSIEADCPKCNRHVVMESHVGNACSTLISKTEEILEFIVVSKHNCTRKECDGTYIIEERIKISAQDNKEITREYKVLEPSEDDYFDEERLKAIGCEESLIQYYKQATIAYRKGLYIPAGMALRTANEKLKKQFVEHNAIKEIHDEWDKSIHNLGNIVNHDLNFSKDNIQDIHIAFGIIDEVIERILKDEQEKERRAGFKDRIDKQYKGKQRQ